MSQGTKLKLLVDSSVPPNSCKQFQIPFTLRQKVEMELHYLQDELAIIACAIPQWATPIVPLV